MLEKFANGGLGLYFTSLGFVFNGGVILRKHDLGEEFRSLNSFICLRISWFVDDKGNGVEVRREDGEDGTGKGFSLQQTEATFTEGCWKFK